MAGSSSDRHPGMVYMQEVDRMVRQACVAGIFYPGSQKALARELETLIVSPGNRKKVLGLIAPHAGYVYSGGCAGKGFGAIQIPDSVVIIGLNHRGYGPPLVIDGHDYWETPLGECPVDRELRQKIAGHSDLFTVDHRTGIEEHSLEVQVPFIQMINPGARILPVIVSSMDLAQLLTAGQVIAECLKGRDDVLMVASTDMSHYIDAETAAFEDQKAIDRILHLDPEGLFKTVRTEQISMCGVSPTVIMLKAAVENGAGYAEVVEYTHSGKTSGDYRQVVAYLSLMVV